MFIEPIIEYRYVKADNIWLSPFYQHITCSDSVHQFIDRDHRPHFDRMEQILRKYVGRPQPGKLHSLSHKELSLLYPLFNDFLRVRKEMDPQGKFLNDFIEGRAEDEITLHRIYCIFASLTTLFCTGQFVRTHEFDPTGTLAHS